MPVKQTLFHTVIRVSKEHSSFVYFILEANEGLAFYSTLPFETGTPYRDIDIKCSFEFKDDLNHLLGKLEKQFTIEYLLQRQINDGQE